MRQSSHSWLLGLALSMGLWHNAIANPVPNEGTCIEGVKQLIKQT